MKHIEYIKKNVKISDFFKKEKLIPNGEGNYKVLSPFKEETNPSFYITTTSDGVQLYKDFSDGDKGGDIFSFLQKYEKKSFIEVYNELCEKLDLIDEKKKTTRKVNTEYYTILSNLAFKFNENIKNKSEVLEYLASRNILEEDIELFNLGWVDKGILSYGYDKAKLLDIGLVKEGEESVYDIMKNRITIPLYDVDNRIVGIATRKFLETDTAGKYINPANSSVFKKNNYLYGFNLAKEFIKEHDFVILVEGYFDLIQLYKNGFKNVVCTLGTALMSDHVKMLAKYTTNFFFCYDGDSAGENSVIKNSKEIIKQGYNIFVIEMPSGKDPDEVLQTGDTEAFKSLIKNSKSLLDYINSKEDKIVEFLEELRSIIPKIPSTIMQQFWYKNIIEVTGIDASKDIKKEFFKRKDEEPLSENDLLFLKTYINSDEEAKKLLNENRFFTTEKCHYIFLKYKNDKYAITFSEDEKTIIDNLKLKKEYTVKDAEKLIKKIKEEKYFNE